MYQELRKYFADTVNANTQIRNTAETELRKIEKNPEAFRIILSQLVVDQDLFVRKAAAIFLVNKLNEHYEELKDFRVELEQNIANYVAMGKEQEIYVKILVTVFNKAEKGKIELILQQAKHFLEQNENSKISGGIKIFESLFKANVLRMSIVSLLEIIYADNAKIFEFRFSEALQNKNWALAKMFMKTLARTYNMYNLPDTLMNVAVFQQNLSRSLSIITTNSNNDNSDFVKLKKWAIFFVYKATNKGVKGYFKNNNLTKFIRKDEVMQHMATTMLSVFDDYKKGIVPHQKFLIYTAGFFEALSSSKNKQIFTPFADQILVNFVVPAYAMDRALEENFEYDPQSYLGERYNYVMNRTRVAVSSLCSSIISSSREQQSKSINFLVQNLYSTSVDLKVKYGILGLLADAQKDMLRVLGVENFHKFIESFICPILVSDSPFMISQAFYFMSLSDEIKMPPKMMNQMLNQVLKFTDHENEVLQVESCLAISFFFYSEEMHPSLKTIMPGLLDKILKFNKQFLLESLNSLMDMIISYFSEFIFDYAPVFTATIVQNIEALWDDKENTDKSLTISSYLQSIDRLTVSSCEKIEIVNKIYELSISTVYKIFQEQEVELFQDGLGLLNTFLFTLEKADGKMYEIFKIISGADPEELILYPDEVCSLMDNFIAFGGETVVTGEVLSIYFSIFNLFLGEDDSDVYFEDLCCACTTVSALMMYQGERVKLVNPQFIPSVVSLMLRHLESIESLGEGSIVHAYEVIMNCFVVDPQVVLVAMGDLFPHFITKACSNALGFKRVIDKKIFLVFLGALYKINLCIDINKLNSALINVFTTLPEAIKKRNSLIDEEEEENDENEEESEEESFEEDSLYEDIYSSTPLDKMDAYDFVTQMLSSPLENSVGQISIKTMTGEQINAIKKVLTGPRQQEKSA